MLPLPHQPLTKPCRCLRRACASRCCTVPSISLCNCSVLGEEAACSLRAPTSMAITLTKHPVRAGVRLTANPVPGMSRRGEQSLEKQRWIATATASRVCHAPQT